MSNYGDQSQPPEWFTRAINTPCESRFVEVEGCPIHYLCWGEPGRPGLLIVPVSGGHAHWYDHVAPLLADQFHVVVVDLSGCGDSGRRDEYTQEMHADEIMAVCIDSGLSAAQVPPTLVGHSAGGQMVVRVAMANGQDLLGIITIDGLRYAELAKDPVLKVLKGPRSRPSPPRIYETYEEAVSRFQLRPAPLEPIANDFILDHIARHSVRSVEGGWTSKYDTAQSLTTTLALELKDALKDLKCQSAAIYAEHTHMSDAGVADMMTTLNDGRATVFVIPGTTHYLPIDSPFAFIAAVKGIALTWIASSGNAKQRPAAP